MLYVCVYTLLHVWLRMSGYISFLASLNQRCQRPPLLRMCSICRYTHVYACTDTHTHRQTNTAYASVFFFGAARQATDWHEVTVGWKNLFDYGYGADFGCG